MNKLIGLYEEAQNLSQLQATVYAGIRFMTQEGIEPDNLDGALLMVEQAQAELLKKFKELAYAKEN